MPRYGDRATSSEATAPLRMARRTPYCGRTVREADADAQAVTRALDVGGCDRRKRAVAERQMNPHDRLVPSQGARPLARRLKPFGSPMAEPDPPIRRVDVPTGQHGVLDRDEPPLGVDA